MTYNQLKYAVIKLGKMLDQQGLKDCPIYNFEKRFTPTGQLRLWFEIRKKDGLVHPFDVPLSKEELRDNL